MAQRRRLLWLVPDRFDVKLDKSTWLETSRCLAARGWEVTIVAGSFHRPPSRPTYDCVQYVRAINLPLVFRITVLIAIARWLKRNAKPHDVVVLNPESLWLSPYLKRIGVRSLHLDFRTLPVDVHGVKGRLDWLLFWLLPMRLFAHGAEGYSFITERLREEVESDFGLNAREYAIWHSGVDLERFRPSPPAAPLNGRPLKLLYHGAVSRKRGLCEVIEALARPDAPPDLEFVIIGDGPDRADLEKVAAELGVANRVRFRGALPYESMPQELAAADLCICPLPIRREWLVSSPLKVFEYMACAKPMILTSIAAHTAVLASSPFVVWSHACSAEDFAAALREAVARYPEIAAAAERAPELARAFEWRVQAARLHMYFNRQRERLYGAERPFIPIGPEAAP